MTMLIHKWWRRPTPSGGKWSDNTEQLSGVQCMQVYVKSTTSDTQFDVLIEDPYGFTVRKWLTATGLVNDLTPTLLYGMHTVKIENSTRDEEFDVLLCFWER
jgi:hypothetical protein